MELKTILYINPDDLRNIGEKDIILAITQPLGSFTQAIILPFDLQTLSPLNAPLPISFATEKDLRGIKLTSEQTVRNALKHNMVYVINVSYF